MNLFADFKHYKIGGVRILYDLFFDRGASAVFLYRLSFWCNNHHMKIISIILRQVNIILNNCEISYNAEIGVGFKIFHSVGIVIGDVKIGNECIVFQNVTIGKNSKKEKNGQRTPVIGDKVILYAGSVIAGPILIGNNVRIGANTVVTENIPTNAKVVAPKPMVIL